MSDRHEKWVRVEPGTVIPAGQPYRVEEPQAGFMLGTEYIADSERVAGDRLPTFIDSSWKPPLDLPTEPTWGIVRYQESYDDRVFVSIPRRFSMEDGLLYGEGAHLPASRMYDPANVLDFIPLTDEQVARIEAAR